jgi:ferredoxin, 2Fe-2S
MIATWILPDGSHASADVKDGQSLMEAAVAIGIPHVIGECGGNLSCATCHVYVTDDYSDRAGTPGDFEDAMLDVTEAERLPSSRLSCQIRMSASLDGIVLKVPVP